MRIGTRERFFSLITVVALSGCDCSGSKQQRPDAGPGAGPDAGPDAGSDAGPDAGSDAGPDAGSDAGPDAGPDAGITASIIEEFHDGAALDPALSTAVVDPRDSGTLSAPVVYVGSDCSGGALAFPADAGTIGLAAGIYQLDSLSIGQNTLVASDGGLDLRLCGGAVIQGQLHADGPLRLTAWSNVVVSSNSRSDGINSAHSLYLALPDAGSSLTLTTGQIYALPSTDAGGGVFVAVNGDLNASGQNGGIWSNGPMNAPADGLTLIVAGDAGIDSVFTEPPSPLGSSPFAAPITLVRVKGNLLVMNVIFTDENPPYPGSVFDVTVGGDLALGSSCIWSEGPQAEGHLHVRGDLNAGCIFVDDGYERTALDIVVGGKLACGLHNPFIGSEVGPLDIRAGSIDLSAGCDIDIYDNRDVNSGWHPNNSSLPIFPLTMEAVSDLHVAATAKVHGGSSTCEPGGSLRMTAGGSITLDAPNPNQGVHGGEAVGSSTFPLSDGGTCSPADGGDLTLEAGGDIDAGTASGGAGAPPGMLLVLPHAAVTVAPPVIQLTQRYLAVSRVYDLGAPRTVAAISQVNLPDPAEGTHGAVEVSMADSAAGPFDTWSTGPAGLGAHRYLRWRVTVDGFFFQSARIDQVRIDFAH